jgi:hypothetical protein
MSMNERLTHFSGPRPRAELVAAGLAPATRDAVTDGWGASPEAVMKELWAIDEQLSAIQRMHCDNAVGADELLAHCVATWSRIKSLRHRLSTARR